VGRAWIENCGGRDLVRSVNLNDYLKKVEGRRARTKLYAKSAKHMYVFF
jgi:hypothetical protein